MKNKTSTLPDLREQWNAEKAELALRNKISTLADLREQWDAEKLKPEREEILSLYTALAKNIIVDICMSKNEFGEKYINNPTIKNWIYFVDYDDWEVHYVARRLLRNSISGAVDGFNKSLKRLERLFGKTLDEDYVVKQIVVFREFGHERSGSVDVETARLWLDLLKNREHLKEWMDYLSMPIPSKFNDNGSDISVVRIAVAEAASLEVIKDVLGVTENIFHSNDFLSVCVEYNRVDVLNVLRDIKHSSLKTLMSKECWKAALSESIAEKSTYIREKYHVLFVDTEFGGISKKDVFDWVRAVVPADVLKDDLRLMRGCGENSSIGDLCNEMERYVLSNEFVMNDSKGAQNTL